MNKKNIIKITIALIIGFIFGLLTKGCNKEQIVYKSIEVIKSDTIVKRDTIKTKEKIETFVPVNTFDSTFLKYVYKDSTRWGVVIDTIKVYKDAMDSINLKREYTFNLPKDSIQITTWFNQNQIIKRRLVYFGYGINYSEREKKVLPNISVSLKAKNDFIYKVGLFNSPYAIQGNRKWYNEMYLEMMIPLKFKNN